MESYKSYKSYREWVDDWSVRNPKDHKFVRSISAKKMSMIIDMSIVNNLLSIKREIFYENDGLKKEEYEKLFEDFIRQLKIIAKDYDIFKE